ncbi:hypothetical protein D9M71_287740 [compost metagenome]
MVRRAEEHQEQRQRQKAHAQVGHQIGLMPVASQQPGPAGADQVVQTQGEHADEHQAGGNPQFTEDLQVGVVGATVQVIGLAGHGKGLGITGGSVVQRERAGAGAKQGVLGDHGAADHNVGGTTAQ